jgi:hypothetical protein
MSSRFRPLASTSVRRPAVHGPFRTSSERRAAERCAADARNVRQLLATLQGQAQS